jgi:hypothetical protein
VTGALMQATSVSISALFRYRTAKVEAFDGHIPNSLYSRGILWPGFSFLSIYYYMFLDYLPTLESSNHKIVFPFSLSLVVLSVHRTQPRFGVIIHPCNHPSRGVSSSQKQWIMARTIPWKRWTSIGIRT